MSEFKESIQNILNALPEQDQGLISDNWEILLLLPKLAKLAQEKLTSIFSVEVLADMERNDGIDYAYFIEEVFGVLQLQQKWIGSLGKLLESEYLVEVSQNRINEAVASIREVTKDIDFSRPKIKELEAQLQELEEQAEDLARLKKQGERLKNRKEELENLKEWVEEKGFDLLDKEVKELEQEYSTIEKQRNELIQNKEHLIQEKEIKTKEINHLVKIQQYLEGDKAILHQLLPAIREHNDTILREMPNEVEMLKLQFKSDKKIASDLGLGRSLKSQFADIRAYLSEVEESLKQKIEENEKQYN